MSAVPVCGLCGRAGQFAGQLEFQSKPIGGALHQVCKGCFLLSELEAYLGILESAGVRNTVISGLGTLYSVARTQVELELPSQAQWSERRQQREGEPTQFLRSRQKQEIHRPW